MNNFDVRLHPIYSEYLKIFNECVYLEKYLPLKYSHTMTQSVDKLVFLCQE